MFTPTLCVVIPATDRAQLAAIAANGNTAQKIAIRARLLLMLADQGRPSTIATRLRLSRNHVHYWLRRYVAFGVRGVVRDASRPGGRTRLTPDKVATIVNATLTTTPPRGDAVEHAHNGPRAGRQRENDPQHLASTRAAAAPRDA